MRKAIRYKKGEPLYKWIERIADYWNFGDELREVLSEVSKESYIQGSNATTELNKKYK